MSDVKCRLSMNKTKTELREKYRKKKNQVLEDEQMVDQNLHTGMPQNAAAPFPNFSMILEESILKMWKQRILKLQEFEENLQRWKS